ncbi:glucose 1-dehydrogenase [Verminephrobacter aporrectodeae subsp. tuberculatae]|uniref:glucose 1-dehydrogenase n=1 Tax=Verminephrobacter aporrectodeae TaxID=1110389 RepID=UPI002238FEB0|nr:glucose 1-dehydrogenase [Verminephrobacter aporrectodeae]MCW5221463.1 glucose 1-dehydrogenase [Verminephrobacter aporrectodeae subsp. tuberculatae]MCW5290754.1 glucose 1-dehydrogenase [Verminephrobacter aporrectodeae subsp. tuberculatae]
MRFKGKMILVTGAASGIGKAIAHRFAEEGARVAIADMSLRAADATAASLAHGAFGIEVDVTASASIAAMVERACTVAGGIDVFVNNAGVFGMEPFLDITERDYDRLFAVNVRGYFFAMQAVARKMVAAGRRGAIVNIASQAGRRGEVHSAIYAATKATAISLSQSAALALVGQGIRVNAIAPGVVDTPMWKSVDAMYARLDNTAIGEKTRQVRAAIPKGRLATAQEIAAAAAFLASDDAEYIVGQTLNVCGGNVLS